MEKGCTHIVLAYMSGNPDFAGGVDSVVLARAQWLAAHGYRATIVCQGSAGFDRPYTREDGVQVRPVMVPQLRKHRTGVLHPLLPGRIASAIFSLHGESPIHLVDIHDGPLGRALESFLQEFAIPSTFTIHSATLNSPTRRFQPIEKFLVRSEQRTAEIVDACFPVSESIQNVIRYATGSCPLITVVPNALSDQVIAAARSKTVRVDNQKPLRILFTGRLNQGKALHVLLDALAAVPQPDRFRLAVLGSGPLETQLRARSDKLSLNSIVSFRGFVAKRSDVVDAYLDADVFVLPSRYEALSISALEALACGTPAVLSDIPANREAGGDAAVFFPVDDAKSLAEALDRIERDRAMLADLSLKAICRARRFSVEVQMPQLAAAYRIAADSGRRRSLVRVISSQSSESTKRERVSVVILTHNLEAYIGDAIRSVLAQSIPPDEVYVSDDCSTDRTVEIAEGHGVTVLGGPKANGNVARNRGARASTGDIVFFLDGDDWWHPFKIESHLAAHREFPGASFICDPARVVHVDRMTRKTIGMPGREELAWADLLDWREWASGSCFSVRRDSFWQAGGFNEDLIALQDVDFWVRAAHALGPARRLRVPLTYYRVIPRSVSKSPRNVAENLKHVLEGWPFLNMSQRSAFSRHVLLTAGRWCRFGEGAQYLALARWPVHRLKFWKSVIHMGRNSLFGCGGA